MQLDPKELKPGQKVWAVRVKYPSHRTSIRPVRVTVRTPAGYYCSMVYIYPPGVDTYLFLSFWVWEFYDNYWEARKRHIQTCPYREAPA